MPRKPNISPTKRVSGVAKTDPPPIRTRSERYSTFYSNNAEIKTGYYDLRIYFNDVSIGDENGTSIEELSSVVMSVEHARDLHTALGRLLQSYESRFGKLRDKPSS